MPDVNYHDRPVRLIVAGQRRNHLNPELLHREAKLGVMVPIDLDAGLGRVPVVTAAICVEAQEQPRASMTSHTPRRLEAVPSSSTKNIS